MIARFIDYTGLLGAENIGLCLARPNVRGDRKVTPDFPSEITHAPISHKESRRAEAKSGRYSCEFLSTMRSAADATELRLFLNALNIDQTVAIPIWTDCVRMKNGANAGATVIPIDMAAARYGAEWIITNSDCSIFEFVRFSAMTSANLTISAPGLANNWPIGTEMCPLAFVRLDGRPEAAVDNPSRGEFTLKFKENSVYERRISPFAQTISTVGAQIPNLSTLPLWNLHPNFVRVMDRSEVETRWSALGFSRVESPLIYNRPVARGLEMTFVCRSRYEIAWLENFVTNIFGQVGAFLIPSFRNDLVLAADLPDGIDPKKILIQTSEYSDAVRAAHPGDPYLAIVDPIDPTIAQHTQNTIDPHKIDTVEGGHLTTNQNITRSHSVATARLSNLMLVRLADSKLPWVYPGSQPDSRAKVTLKFLELPFEYVTPAPAIKQLADLYILEEVKRFSTKKLITSFEKDITIAQGGAYDGTYYAEPIDYKSENESTDLTAEKLDIETGAIDGNPISKFFPWRLEGLVKLTHLTCNVNDLTEPVKVRFTGQVTEPNPSLTESIVKPFGNLADLQIPCHLLTAIDNYVLGDAALGLDPNALKISGPIYSINSNTIVVTSAAAFAKAADYFGGAGWVQLGADSDHEESRAVLHSAPVGPDKVQLVLERPLLLNVVGANVDIFPSYDGSAEQLDSRFADLINHGGFRYVPDKPLNIKAVETKTPGGGKGGK